MRPHTAWGLPTTVTALREPSYMNQHKMATSLNSDPLQQTDSCLNYFLVPWSAFLLICTQVSLLSNLVKMAVEIGVSILSCTCMEAG